MDHHHTSLCSPFRSALMQGVAVSFCFSTALWGASEPLAPEGAVTLDPAAFAEVWNGSGAAAESGLILQTGRVALPQAWARWLAAMQSREDALFCIRLLLWLQEHNPTVDISGHEAQYAAAVELHRMGRAGQQEACLLLEQACRVGKLPCGLSIPVADTVAQWWAQRAQLPAFPGM